MSDGQSERATSHDSPEELLEHWRSLASMAGWEQTETFNARCETYAKCADELEEVLES